MTTPTPLPLSARVFRSLARAERFRPAMGREEIERRLPALPFPVSPAMVDLLTEFEATVGGLKYTSRGPNALPVNNEYQSAPMEYGLVATADSYEFKVRKDNGKAFFCVGGDEAFPFRLDAEDGTFYDWVYPKAASYRVFLEANALLDDLLDQQPTWHYANLGTFDPEDRSLDGYFADECGIPVVPEVNEDRLRCWRSEQVLVRRYHDPIVKVDIIQGWASRGLIAFQHFMGFFNAAISKLPPGSYDLPFRAWPAETKP